MNHFKPALQDQPDCFGTRRDLVVDPTQCSGCSHNDKCLSAVWAVFDAVKQGQLSTNDYLPSELREFRRNHDRTCRLYGVEAAQQFPLNVIDGLHQRVLPSRSIADIEFAKAWQLLEDEEPLACDAGSSGDKATSKFSYVEPPSIEGDRRTEVKETRCDAPVAVERLDGTAAATMTSVSASRATTDHSLKHYEFVGFDLLDQYSGMSNENLEDELASLCERTMPRHRNPLSYMQIRERYCAINMVLNKRGLRPPRCRISTRVPWTSKGTQPLSDEMKTLSNDRKIIDLEWLHAIGTRDRVKDIEFSDLFQHEVFDYDLAARFVQKRWKSDTRASRILCLADVEEWQLAMFATDAERKRWKDVNDRAIRVERSLKGAAYRRPQLAQDIADFKLLWIADQICNGTNQCLIGTVHGWLKGAPPLAPSTLSAKLKRMRRLTSDH